MLFLNNLKFGKYLLEKNEWLVSEEKENFKIWFIYTLLLEEMPFSLHSVTFSNHIFCHILFNRFFLIILLVWPLKCFYFNLQNLQEIILIKTVFSSLWLQNKSVKLLPAKGYTAAFALRQRMLNFIQNLEYYMMIEVIEPKWHIFLNRMETVSVFLFVIANYKDPVHIPHSACLYFGNSVKDMIQMF